MSFLLNQAKDEPTVEEIYKAHPIPRETQKKIEKLSKPRKSKPKYPEEVIFAVKQWIRIRGPRARKNKGSEYLILKKLEKWLEGLK